MNQFFIFLMMAFLLVSSISAAYLWLIAFFGIKVRNVEVSQRFNRFAILVPVHNEEGDIHIILDSLVQLDYPKELYDCFFVADNCSDNTAETITRRGVKCFQKNDRQAGKAKALGWLLKQIEKDSYDAFLFFDADNRPAKDFLGIMNVSLNRGNEVIQGCPEIDNWRDSVFSVLNQVNYVTINRLKENARSNLGLSCRLRGHGMCFKRDLIDKLQWDTDSDIEDQDLFFQVILAGKRVVWEHSAKVFSRLSSDTHSSKKQRLRWSKAKHANYKKYIPKLLNKIINRPDKITLDALIETITPANSTLVAVAVIGWAISFSMIWWASITLILYLLYFLLGAVLEKIPFKYLLYFLFSPVFVFWRAWIYVLSFRKPKERIWS